MTCTACSNYKEISDLSTLYVIRTCPKCGRKANLRDPGTNGHGFQILKGDEVTMPAGWLQFSANPLKGNGNFTKFGLEWFAQLIFVADMPNSIDKLGKAFVSNEDFCTSRLSTSELLKGHSFETEEQSQLMYELLSKNQQSVEWWLYLFGLFNAHAKECVAAGDASGAAAAMSCAERSRSMAVYKENLEEVVWMGHSAKRLVNVIQKWHSNKEQPQEEYWQQLFLENSYVLSQLFSAPVVFSQNKAYVGGMKLDRQDARLVDYLYQNSSSSEAILVEIKTPLTQLLNQSPYRNGIHSPSSKLSGSVVQLLNYRRSLTQNIHSLRESHKEKLEVFNPKCVLIVGNAEAQLDSTEKRESFELFRSGLKDVEIVTFDELFKKAETLASLFNLQWQPPQAAFSG